MDIVHPSRHGIVWHELQVPLEMGPPFGVVSDRVTVAPEWQPAYIQGKQGFPGFRSALLSYGISEISRGGGGSGAATPMHFSPLLRGPTEVAGLMCTPQGPALDIPEALLALGLSRRHEASFEGVPHRH